MINKLKICGKVAIMIAFGGIFLLAYVIDANSAHKAPDHSFDFLKCGISPYKNGQINQAISAFQCAAYMGNIGQN